MEWLREDSRELAGRIKWLMTLRVVVVTFMLGFTVLLQFEEGTAFFTTPLRSLYLFIGIFYLLTIIYSVAFHRGVDGPSFALIQILIDLVLISGIMLVTGGVASLFSITYFLAIIGASILLYKWGSLLTAGVSTVLYSLAVWAPFSPSVSRVVDYKGTYLSLSHTYVGYRIILTSFGFFLVAVLSSYLAESLRRTGIELSAASDHLAEVERRSENILQNISSGLITTDLSGRINYTNRVAERIARIEAGDVLGKLIQEVFHFKDDWDPYSDIQALRDDPCRVEVWIDRSGEDHFLGMTFSLLRDEEGKVEGVICSFQDLTQIKKMEEQIRRSDRLAVVGELAAGMAHEIRNPLASMSGSIQLLSEGLVLDETGRELMEIINCEVSRLNSIITDFLRFASPRPLELKVVNILGILRETATLLRRSSPASCEIVVESGDSEECLVEADPKLMKQVFWNFSRNAIEAMPNGGRLTLAAARVAREVEEGKVVDHLQITFSDNGVGISPEEIEKVFTPFHSTKEQGTGLGLAIVSKIVEAHRGKIDVQSRVGKGTIFSVTLPVRQAVTTLAPLPMGATV
jgi:two-component system sensor histidine kinase PilS (NtrC family)